MAASPWEVGTIASTERLVLSCIAGHWVVNFTRGWRPSLEGRSRAVTTPSRDRRAHLLLLFEPQPNKKTNNIDDSSLLPSTIKALLSCQQQLSAVVGVPNALRKALRP